MTGATVPPPLSARLQVSGRGDGRGAECGPVPSPGQRAFGRLAAAARGDPRQQRGRPAWARLAHTGPCSKLMLCLPAAPGGPLLLQASQHSYNHGLQLRAAAGQRCGCMHGPGRAHTRTLHHTQGHLHSSPCMPLLLALVFPAEPDHAHAAGDTQVAPACGRSRSFKIKVSLSHARMP